MIETVKSGAPWRWPRLIAHRGAGALAPENTLAACRAGGAHGYKMMEYDVKLSKDGVPILLHDDTIDRTSSGSGRASELSFAQMQPFDFGGWHSPAYCGEPIATLYAVAAFTRANDISSNIEIKPCAGTEADTGRAIALTARSLWAGANTPPLLSSFSETALAAAAQAAPELPRALLFEEAPPRDWRRRVDALGCLGLNLNDAHVDEALSQTIISAGYTLAIWTVNDLPRVRELFAWGCHAIVTDRIDIVRPEHY